MRILIVEDDLEAGAAMCRGLGEAGHDCLHVGDGALGLKAAGEGEFDVMVVDRMTPNMDGPGPLVETPAPPRRCDAGAVPLGPRRDRGSASRALKAGGDDYLVKPYALIELVARVEAPVTPARDRLGRHPAGAVGELEMDLIGRTVRREGKTIDLQPREFQPAGIPDAPCRPVGDPHYMLLEKVWEYHFDPQTNVIDVHVSRLRAKLDKDFDRPMLLTVRGAGYRLEA